MLKGGLKYTSVSLLLPSFNNVNYNSLKLYYFGRLTESRYVTNTIVSK
jgi:hypothetical protein